jgi:hypothetical protein
MSEQQTDVALARQSLIERWGPWRGYNIRLSPDVYTIAPNMVGPAERRIASVAQVVTDVAGGSLAGLRILDLGAHEGGFGVEMAMRGASVVCVEARVAHVHKIEFAKQCLGLDQLSIVQSDVRNIDHEQLGSFDVVLCLGLLYHLPSHDLLPFMHSLAKLCGRFMVLETQVSIRPRRSFPAEGRSYHGRAVPEDPAFLGAAVDRQDSFWLTRPSLLNMLSAAGFSSAMEILNPVVVEVAAYADHVRYVAFRGDRVTPASTVGAAGAVADWPERLGRVTHPAQSLFGSFPLLRRLARKRLGRVIGGKQVTR